MRGLFYLDRVYRWRLGSGAVLLRLVRVRCRSFLHITISPCAGRHLLYLSNGDKESKQRKRLQTPAPR
jgi:hypothetical protein